MVAWNQKGEGRGGLIFGLLILFLAVYTAWKIIPVMIRVYTFDDAVKEECKFLRGRSLDQLKEDIVDAAKGQDLPVTEDDVNVRQFRKEEHQELKVDITYSVPIATPLFVYDWKQEIHYQAPSFD